MSWWRRPTAGLELAWPPKMSWGHMPAVDIAELPGLDEADIDVSVANGMLRIKGEKKEKDYCLCERCYGSFQCSFAVPDADKISASFKKAVLTVTLPKTAEARSSKKKIPARVD